MKVISYEVPYEAVFLVFLVLPHSTVFSDILNVWASYPHRVRKASNSYEARLKIGFT